MSAKINLTDDVKTLIAEFHLRHPKWKAPMIQIRVSELLHHKNPQLPKGWPGLSAVRKVLTEVKKIASEPSPEDKPWSTAMLDSYPIPPQALPVVLKVWKSRIEKDSNLTIREAKWVSRLSNAIPDIIPDIEKLTETARRYALVEQLYDMTGRHLNSRGLDKRLMNLPFDDFDEFEPRVSDLPPYLDKDGEVIDFSSPDAKERFQAKRKGGAK